jgi:hypothetical protein
VRALLDAAGPKASPQGQTIRVVHQEVFPAESVRCQDGVGMARHPPVRVIQVNCRGAIRVLPVQKTWDSRRVCSRCSRADRHLDRRPHPRLHRQADG